MLKCCFANEKVLEKKTHVFERWLKFMLSRQYKRGIISMSIATEGRQKKGSDSKSLKQIISRLSMIGRVLVNVVLNRTVVVDSD